MRYQRDNAPIFNGFLAGTSLKGYPAFIGRSFQDKQFQPGFVQFEPPVGIYVTSTIGERLATEKLEYLTIPYQCKCSWMDKGIAMSRPGLVRTPDETYHYMVGRYRFGCTDTVAITKVVAPSFRQWYFNADGLQVTDTATELLVCESTDTTGSLPVVNIPYLACGE